jgi:hypothetical protein
MGERDDKCKKPGNMSRRHAKKVVMLFHFSLTISCGDIRMKGSFERESRERHRELGGSGKDESSTRERRGTGWIKCERAP